MMSKNLTQKIIIAIVIVLSFNFAIPNFSRADIGGKLFGPVVDLVAAIFDAGLYLVQKIVDGGDITGSSKNSFTVKSSEFQGKDAEANKEKYGMEVKDKNGKETTAITYPTIASADLDKEWWGLGDYTIPIVKYGPEKIFSNEVPALDANFINPTDWQDETRNDKSIAYQLHGIISSWYNALRNLVVVGLLSILVYVGIRMMLTSIASDKAKYKQMFMDWLIALCLVFFMHYIMSFIMSVTQMITNGLSGANNIKVVIDDGVEYATSLLGVCRLQVEYKDFFPRMLYLVLYIALVIYTIKFTLKYIQRAITMAFLTLMAPLVTLTYPIDKIGDGKAQAFNMWLKEYVFNALLQPFHLIIYTIFLSTSLDIAVTNPIYAIIVLAFMGPAENILRKFFGFEKTGTAGSAFMGGFGGAAVFNGVKKLATSGAKKFGGGSGSGGSKKIRQQDSSGLEKPVKDENAPSGYGAFAQSGANAGGAAINAGPNATGAAINAGSRNAIGAAGNAGPSATGAAGNAGPRNATGSAGNAGPRNATGAAAARVPQNRFTRTIKGAVGNVGRSAKDKARRTFTTSAGRRALAAKVAKAGIRTATTATGLAIGLGAGIAGDDLSDVFKYGAAGATLGGTALGSAVIGAGSTIKNSGLANALVEGGREGYYGSDNAAELAAQADQLRYEGELREEIRDKIKNEDGTELSAQDLTEYENRAIDHIGATGINNYDDAIKALKLEDGIRNDLATANPDMDVEERNNYARLQAQTIEKIAQKTDEEKLATDEKYRQGKLEDFRKGLVKANPNISQSDLENNSRRMMQLLCKRKKVNY